jgi:hypothetical protein
MATHLEIQGSRASYLGRNSVGCFLTATVLIFGSLLMPSPAHADYEQVPEHFASTGEAQRMLEGEVQAMAVNSSGAGGVGPGTLYVVTSGSGKSRRAVLRFAPGSEGEEPEFQEAWGWALGSEAEEFQRCGPALTTEPAQHTFHTCANVNNGRSFGGEGVGHFEPLSGVAVDQANGFVYVRNEHVGPRKRNLIEVFTATGTPIGEGFANAGNEASVPPESIAEGPENVHNGDHLTNSLTVDEAGTVYVNDRDYSGVQGQPEHRVMSFRPAGGSDFAHYVYAGQGDDLVFAATEDPQKLALAAGNRLVTAASDQIHTYALQGGAAVPLCSLPITTHLTAMTANPQTGEVFYFGETKRSIFRLAPCDETTGKFAQLQQIVPIPKTELDRALAVDPSRSWSLLRPTGILYTATEMESGLETSAVGDIFAPAPILSPAIDSESVANTGTTSSTLQASIDPRGFKTAYVFQYLPASTYESQLADAEAEGKSGAEAQEAAFAGAAAVPSSPGQIESGAVRVAAVSIGDLSTDTAYRFRVVATSECNGTGEPICVTDGMAASFATFPGASFGLPDGRAYELVSPPQKSGGEVFPADPTISSCGVNICKPPGTVVSAVFPMQSSPTGDSVAYMGYAFTPIGSPTLNSYISQRNNGGWMTTDESPIQQSTKSAGTLAYNATLTMGALAEPDISLQETNNPAALTSIIPAPRYREPGNLQIEYAGYSHDFAAQFFAANDALTLATPSAPEPPDPGAAGRDLYEWRGGQLSLVNVLPGNTTVATGAAFASSSPDTHAVSVGGDRVYWHVGSTLYVREHVGEAEQITRPVAHPGAFVTASEDGGNVLLSDGCLYSLASEACTDLTQGQGGFQGVAGASGDLSRIYFVSTTKIPAALKNIQGEEAVSGKPNLYLYESGAPTRFIATLAASDEGTKLNDWSSNPGARTAEASPAGAYLAFASTRPLTGYENIGPCETITNAKNELEVVAAACKEVFLYDSVTGNLTCVSCNPTGESPLGNSTLRRIASPKPFFPQPRYLTDTGELFFDSADRLSPLDTNRGVEDVYEAEPDGVGTCMRAAGCISLISPGTGSVDSNFLAMGGEGSNVFFTTRARLVPKDTDDLIDLYDAREGGGFSDEGEAAGSACRGEACQSAPNAPETPAAASSTFQGSGNVKPKKSPRCSKGKVKRNGKCRKPGKKHKHHKQKLTTHHTRGGGK